MIWFLQESGIPEKSGVQSAVDCGCPSRDESAQLGLRGDDCRHPRERTLQQLSGRAGKE
jgi:hypothetical protein